MKAEEIDKAAEKYFESVICENCRESRLDAFRTGVRLCKPEIDELVGVLRKVNPHLSSVFKQLLFNDINRILKKYENE